MKRSTVPWVVLGALVIAALVWAAWPGGSQTASERAHELATELRCPDCEGLSVADSSSSSGAAIRRDVRTRVNEGQSDEVIRQAYVDRYGESILLDPQGGGLGFLVWGVPFVALVLGAGGLALAMRRWRREPRMHATAADESLVATTRSDRGGTGGGE
jgi:cytochrome c-type biogenesis protein CcmH